MSFGKLLTGVQSVAPRPWLGVSLNETQPDIQIVRVSPDSPAAVAGLLAKDRLIAINHRRVYNIADFYEKLWATEMGGAVELVIARDGGIMAITVQSGDRADWYK